MWVWLTCIIGAYLIGSIPFGVLIARSRGIDIRKHGSKNIGATNVGRVLGRKYGIVCFILDCLKGAVLVIVAGLWSGCAMRHPNALEAHEMWLWLAVALAAVLGHMFPVYIKLKGGKGVATGFGALVAMWPVLTLPALAALVVWFVMLKSTRYMAVASMTGAVTLPIATAVQAVVRSDVGVRASLDRVVPMLAVTAALAVLVVWRHRSNLARLAAGTESKMGTPAGPAELENDVDRAP